MWNGAAPWVCGSICIAEVLGSAGVSTAVSVLDPGPLLPLKYLSKEELAHLRMNSCSLLTDTVLRLLQLITESQPCPEQD